MNGNHRRKEERRIIRKPTDKQTATKVTKIKENILLLITHVIS